MKGHTTNFRAITLGCIAPGVLYRSEHPVPRGEPNNKVIRRARQAGINCVINLHDNEAGVRKAAEVSPWYCGLFSRNRIAGLDLDFDFASPEFNTKLRRGIEFMLAHDGPCLIHCYAGVDRTGFFCALIEALMGASLEEIAADYRLSFENDAESALYQGDSAEAGNVILEQLAVINNATPLTDSTLQPAAERYFTDTLDLGTKKVMALKERLAGVRGDWTCSATRLVAAATSLPASPAKRSAFCRLQRNLFGN